MPRTAFPDVPSDFWTRRELHAWIHKSLALITQTADDDLRLLLERSLPVFLDLDARLSALPLAGSPRLTRIGESDGWTVQWIGSDIELHDHARETIVFRVSQRATCLPGRDRILTSDCFRLDLPGETAASPQSFTGTRQEVRATLRLWLRQQGFAEARRLAYRFMPP